MTLNMIKILSAKILPDDHIIAESPIIWEMGKIRMETPLLSYKLVRDFNKTSSVLAEYFLVSKKENLSDESREWLDNIYDSNPILKIYDDFGLPYFLIKISKPANIEKAIQVYNDFCDGKATRLGNITDNDLDNFREGKYLEQLNICLTDYLMYNSTAPEIFDLFKQIQTREQVIKKKLVEILTEKIDQKQGLPVSSHNARILEFQQRKRQRLSRSSKFS